MNPNADGIFFGLLVATVVVFVFDGKPLAAQASAVQVIVTVLLAIAGIVLLVDRG